MIKVNNQNVQEQKRKKERKRKKKCQDVFQLFKINKASCLEINVYTHEAGHTFLK